MAKRVFKTKKKLSGGNNIYRAWDNWEEGDVLIGEYVGTGPTDKYGKDTFQFKVEDAQFADKKAAKALTGKVLTLNFTGGFAKSMKSVEDGDMIQITYNGQNEMTKGEWAGEMAHAIDVDLIEEDTGESDDEDDSDDDSDDDDDDNEEEDGNDL